MPGDRILIVDDSKIDRMILQRAFDKIGSADIEVEEAVDAPSAIKCLEECKFDAIFLDINMPGYNGFTVLRAIREQNKSSWPLVFMYSSSMHPDDVAMAYGEMATAFLTKPTDFARVRDLVSNCVDLIKTARKAG